MKGTVLRSTGSQYIVLLKDKTILTCRIKGRFRLEGSKSTNPIAVGDLVETEAEDSGNNGVITELLPRKNYIIRRSANLSKQTHVIAANLDHAYIVVTLAMPRTSLGFVDRLLATAEAYSIPASIIFNKTDIYAEEGLNELAQLSRIYESAGYSCHRVSAKNGEGIGSLNKLMKGKVNLITGHSGVGKSTLINALIPGLELPTGELSEAHEKGMHHTTFAEMHRLPESGFLIDTPGLKEFGIINVAKEELSHFFPDIFRIAKDCRFSSCLHMSEPGCAVTAAVETNQLAVSRYNSYYGIVSGTELNKEFDD